MPTTPINGLPSPDSTSPNNPPAHFDALNAQLDSRLVARFATTTARDAAITSPINGMVVWCDSPGAYYERSGGAWMLRYAGGPRGYLTSYVPSGSAGAAGVTQGLGPGTANYTVPANWRVKVTAKVPFYTGGPQNIVNAVLYRRAGSSGALTLLDADDVFLGNGNVFPNRDHGTANLVSVEVPPAGSWSWLVAAKHANPNNTGSNDTYVAGPGTPLLVVEHIGPA